MHLTLRELLARAADRTRHVPSRALELAELRARFTAARGTERLPSEQVERARRLRALRQEMAGALRGVSSCGGCGRGHDLPEGRWDGGFCCSGHTHDLFSDAEITALKAAGVRGRDLRAPASDHAGCAFRGPTGCSLEPVQRPSQCLRYLCRTLRAELGRAGRLTDILVMADALGETQDSFSAALADQEEDDAWWPVERRLRALVPPSSSGPAAKRPLAADRPSR